jgi:DNA-binding cell septation regulator SpoVG
MLPMVADDDETAPVNITVLQCERVAGMGRIRALASVAINVGGVEFELRGIRIIESRNGDVVSISPPVFRGRLGEWIEAVVLPPELRRPIGALVGAAFAELGGDVDLGLALPGEAVTDA